jgi:hypothetical protein
MAILESIDGRFYDIPDKELAQYVVPADKVGELLKEAGASAPAGQPQPVAQGQVQAYHHGWGRRGGLEIEIGGGYPNYVNYSNYSNYSNYRNWGW